MLHKAKFDVTWRVCRVAVTRNNCRYSAIVAALGSFEAVHHGQTGRLAESRRCVYRQHNTAQHSGLQAAHSKKAHGKANQFTCLCTSYQIMCFAE